MSNMRFRPLCGFIGLSLALIPVQEVLAGESILRVGSKSVAVPDGNGGLDSAEKQDAIAKMVFMQNYDKTGKAFTMSLPPWARPVKDFLPGIGLSDPSDGAGPLISSARASEYAFGMGAPRMGMFAPAGVHKPMMVTSELTMQEDVPKITFESCVRMKLNSGIGLETAFQMCQSANSGYKAPAIPKMQPDPTGKTSGSDAAAPAEASRVVTQAALPAPPAATGWIPQAQELSADKVTKAGASGYAGSECDVSRDPSVMLSQECLSRADSLLEGGMASAGAGALHVPLSMQPGQPQDGHHSLLANIAPRSVPSQEVDFASVDAGRMIQRNMTAPSGQERQVGSISCDWVVNGASFVGVQYGHGRNRSVKACIQAALTSANIDTGTIGVSLKDQAHGLSLTVVECHRRNGRDTCGVIR